jgi:tubulin-specific chaperone A
MPPPSQLAIATSSLQRLIKEEASYHAELAQQQKSLERQEQRREEEMEEGESCVLA